MSSRDESDRPDKGGDAASGAGESGRQDRVRHGAEDPDQTHILTESAIIDTNDLPPPRPKTGARHTMPPPPPPAGAARVPGLKPPSLGASSNKRAPFSFSETLKAHPKPAPTSGHTEPGHRSPTRPPTIPPGLGQAAAAPTQPLAALVPPAAPAPAPAAEPTRTPSGGFVRLPTSVRQNLADDIGLEHDAQLDEATADYIAQYDGELAAIGPGASQQAARLHLAVGRMLEAQGHGAAAQRRYQAARMRDAESVAALRELRRRARSQGQLVDVLELLEAESHLVKSPARRAAIYEERARLLRRTAGAGAALAELERVRQLVPDSRPAVESERAIHASAGDWERVVDALVREADLTSDARLEMALRLIAAEILEHRLGRDDEAVDGYVRALKLVPSHRVALAGAERLLARRQRWHELYELMVRQGQATRDPDQVYGLYVRAGILAAERLGDSRSAVSCFESAHSLRPHETLPLRLLVEVHRGKEAAWQRLDETYVRLLAQATAPSERVALTLARAENLIDHVHPPDAAIGALLALHAEQPSNPVLLERLRPLLVGHGRSAEYIDLCWGLAERTEPGPLQRERFVALGEFCELRAGVRDRARACYRRALTADDGHAPARELDAHQEAALAGLERLLVEDRNDRALAELYALAVDRIQDCERRASVLWRLANLQDARLAEPMAALETLTRYRELRPDDLDAVWMRQRLHGQQGIWTGLVADLRDEIRLVHVPQRRAELHHRVATIQELRLDDRRAAIESVRAALREAPEHLPAHRALVRMLREAERWEELADALEAMLAHAPADERAALLHELGTLYAQRLGDVGRAVDAFERTLDADPRFLPAFASLQQLHRSAGEWAALRDSLERELDAALPPARRAGNLTRIAALLAERFDRPEEAIPSLRAALQARPGYAPAAQALERLQGQLARWEDLARLLNELLLAEQNVETRAHIAYRFAALLNWRLGRPGDATQPLELALALAPELPGVRLDLEMLYRQLGQNTEAAELLYEQAKHTDDVAAAIAFFKESTDIQSLDAELDPTRSLHRILQHDPLDFMAIERLEGRAEHLGALVDLWQRRLQQPEGDEFVELRLALAEIVGASHAEAASDLLQEAVEHAPGHLPALRMAANAAVAAGHHEAACALREKEADVVQDPRTKVAALLTAAHIARDQLGQFPRARKNLRSALELVPSRADLYEMLAELLTLDKLWPELAQVLALHVAALDPLARPPRLLELVRLQRDRLGDRSGAVATLHELLAIEPAHPQALVALARLETDREHWHEAVDAWRRALATGTGSAAERRTWSLALATALLERLDRPAEAEPVLHEMLARDPGDADALRMLAHLYHSAGRLDDAARVLERIAEVSAPAEAAAVLVRLARVLDALERGGEARKHLAAAAQMIRKDVASLEPLVAWADETGGHETLAALLEDVVVSAPARMGEAMVPVRLALARILSEKLSKRDAAEREARMAATSDPRNVDAQLAAARLQVERAETRRFAMQALALDPFRAEAFRLLARGFEQAGLTDAVYRCEQVLCVLGDPEPALRQHADELVEHAGTPQAPLGPEGVLQFLAHPKLPEWGRELLYRAGPRAQVFEIQGPPIEPFPDSHPARAQAYHTAAIFGAADFELVLTPQPGLAVAFDAERPNRLILGQLALQGSLAEMRYHIGVGLAPMVLGTPLLEVLDDRDFVRLLQGLIGLAHTGYGEDAVVKQLRKFLPRKNRKAVEEYARAFDPRSLHLDLGEWRRAMTLTSRRAGLLASRDTRAAVAGLLRSQGQASAIEAPPAERIQALRAIVDAGDLLSFTVADAYARVRRQLAMNRDPAGREG